MFMSVAVGMAENVIRLLTLRHMHSLTKWIPGEQRSLPIINGHRSRKVGEGH
jgi:hypothetical protein